MRIPKGTPKPLDREDVARLVGRLQERINGGVEKYQGSFMLADLKTDLIEELLDQAAYALLMIERIERTLPSFDGMTSNEIMGGS